MINLKTYKVLSKLLIYPDNLLKDNIDDAINILKYDNILNELCMEKIFKFRDYIKNNDILFLQEYYVSVFDRQQQFSLYIFEHIHGDSRERGMAMVDLKNLYKSSNFDLLDNLELPDFIPVFLEYLSINNLDRSSMLLGEIINIVSILNFRLQKINSPYYIIFYILESLSNVKSDISIINKVLNN